MKNFKLLQTDYYQLSMVMAYIMNDKANEIAGFEGFIRHIKSAVNPEMNYYIFDGEDEVKDFIKTITIELQDPELKETFIKLIEPKITADNKDEIIADFYKKWENLETNFEYNVVPNDIVVLPLVPVFQYKGPRWIGQLLETYVTNIYNGKTALATINHIRESDKLSLIADDEFEYLNGIMQSNPFAINEYTNSLKEVAKEFRDSTDKILLEAAFRRAPSHLTAYIASKVALDFGWNGTSNTSVVLDGSISDEFIGGTMAHAFVMSFANEREAFKAWDKVFPGTTFLIDTYDVINAAKLIKEMVVNGKITMPKEVRIDSDPLDEYCTEVDKIFEGKMGIFISGDMSVEKFEHFETMRIPYTKAMAGTKYVYDSMIVEKLNSGFVYKLVEYIDENGKTIRPEKKATGKKNYPGLKQCSYDFARNVLTVWCGTDEGIFGFNGIEKITPSTKVEFKN